MKTRKLAFAFAVAALIALAIPVTAQANFAIHGNYVADTDACAGCHRAHTSVSTITWSQTDSLNNTTQRSALLVSSATQMWQFCYACHDATSQGAETNVQYGLYEGDDYGTFGAVLNGGGFESVGTTQVTSTHMYQGSSWGAYGGGTEFGQGVNAFPNPGATDPIKMDCGTCHDPHGSANYRILKSSVNGVAVGGYVGTGTDPDPDGYVSSVETGWPAGGFRLHTAYPDYKPNYTTALYAKGYDMIAADGGTLTTDDLKGMSGWCAGCHTQYLLEAATFTKSDGTTYTASASAYNAGDGAGLKVRHRHPINVPLSNYMGPSSMIVTDSVLPLAHSLDESSTGTVPRAQRPSDWIECLTCHRAHGTAANMTGYASHAGAASVVDTDGVARNNFVSQDPIPSSLLRLDNRGVCEVCHNK